MNIEQKLASKVELKFRKLGIPCPKIDFSDVVVDISPSTDAPVFAAFANDFGHAQFVDIDLAAENAVEAKADEIVNAILASRPRSRAVHSFIERCFQSDKHHDSDSRPNSLHDKAKKSKTWADFKEMNQTFSSISPNGLD